MTEPLHALYSHRFLASAVKAAGDCARREAFLWTSLGWDHAGALEVGNMSADSDGSKKSISHTSSFKSLSRPSPQSAMQIDRSSSRTSIAEMSLRGNSKHDGLHQQNNLGHALQIARRRGKGCFRV